MIFGLSNAEGAAALSGVASLAGAGVQAHEQRKAIREQGKQNMELAKYQFDKFHVLFSLFTNSLTLFMSLDTSTS